MDEDYEKYCDEVVQNFFPDCVELRSLCKNKGYLPAKHRAELWNLLLNSSLLQNDAEIVEGESNAEDVVELFCRRMARPVTNEIVAVFKTLLLSSMSPSLPKASACLYTFCNYFLPTFLLKDENEKTRCEKVVSDKLSTLLRVLVLYHFPVLAIHLDGILPDWAKLCAHPVLGSIWNSKNIIPNVWLGGLFAGSVLQYPNNVLRLWDWCVCWGEQFIGVYLVVALLGLQENILRNCTKPDDLHQWLHQICVGGKPMYMSCDIFRDTILSKVSFREEKNETSPDELLILKANCPHDSDGKGEKHERKINSDDEREDHYDEDGDEDDEFPLSTNNLSMMNEIHNHRTKPNGNENVMVHHPANSCIDELLSSALDHDIDLHYQNYEVPQEDNTQARDLNTFDLTSESVELTFLSGWLQVAVYIIRNTPMTFRDTLRNLVVDTELLLKKKVKSRLDSSHDLSNSDDIDNTTHGFSSNENECSDVDNYEEESGSEFHKSIPSSPLSPAPVKDELSKKNSSSGIFDMLSKSLKFSEETHPPRCVRPVMSTTPRKWFGIDYRTTACVGTTGEEVIPCICSNRRCETNGSSARLLLNAFCDGALSCLHDVNINGEGAGRTFPAPSSCDDDMGLFYFAIDCWSETLYQGQFSDTCGRLCKIPKALQIPSSEIMNENVIDMLLSFLRPISGFAHIVLIGIGDEILFSSYANNPSITHEAFESIVHAENAHLGALSLSLAKQGIPYVSIMDGGYGSVVRCIWNSENVKKNERCGEMPLNFDMLFDVDHDAIRDLFIVDDESQDNVLLSQQEDNYNETEVSTLLGNSGDNKKEIEYQNLEDRKAGVSAFAKSTKFTDIVSPSTMAGIGSMFSQKMFSYTK